MKENVIMMLQMANNEPKKASRALRRQLHAQLADGPRNWVEKSSLFPE